MEIAGIKVIAWDTYVWFLLYTSKRICLSSWYQTYDIYVLSLSNRSEYRSEHKWIWYRPICRLTLWHSREFTSQLTWLMTCLRWSALRKRTHCSVLKCLGVDFYNSQWADYPFKHALINSRSTDLVFQTRVLIAILNERSTVQYTLFFYNKSFYCHALRGCSLS